METLLNTVDEVLSMIDMTSKTLEKVEWFDWSKVNEGRTRKSHQYAER